MHNLSDGNEFDLQDNEHARETQFQMNGCALRLALKQKTRQLGIGLFIKDFVFRGGLYFFLGGGEGVEGVGKIRNLRVQFFFNPLSAGYAMSPTSCPDL